MLSQIGFPFSWKGGVDFSSNLPVCFKPNVAEQKKSQRMAETLEGRCVSCLKIVHDLITVPFFPPCSVDDPWNNNRCAGSVLATPE
jgi:hypothetical protein